MPSFRPHLLRLAGLLLGGGLVAFAGCSSSGSSTISVTHPTMIRVEPEDFLGAVPCDLNGSGFKRYVATIVDYNYGEGGEGGAASSVPVADGGANPGGAPVALLDAQGFQAPSSLPTPCTTGVGFGFVVPGRHYEVFIDGYDTADLTPRALGSREMLPLDETDAVHTSVLKPRWQTRCRRAIATDSTIVRADQCEPFPEEDAAAGGSVRVALSSLLGQLHCGSAPGEVERFEVSGALPDGTPLEQEVPCPTDSDAAPAAALFTGLPGRAKLSFYVQAFSADQDPLLPLAGAQCNALAQAGANVEATCAALTKVGTVELDVVAALAKLGRTCSLDSVSNVIVEPTSSIDDSPRSLPPPDCLQPFTRGFDVSQVVDGNAKLTLTALTSGDEASLDCFATVKPGRVVQAMCP